MSYKRYCYKCGRENATWNPKCEFCTQNDIIQQQAEETRRQNARTEQDRRSEFEATRYRVHIPVENEWDRMIRFAESTQHYPRTPTPVPTPEELKIKREKEDRENTIIGALALVIGVPLLGAIVWGLWILVSFILTNFV